MKIFYTTREIEKMKLLYYTPEYTVATKIFHSQQPMDSLYVNNKKIYAHSHTVRNHPYFDE